MAGKKTYLSCSLFLLASAFEVKRSHGTCVVLFEVKQQDDQRIPQNPWTAQADDDTTAQSEIDSSRRSESRGKAKQRGKAKETKRERKRDVVLFFFRRVPFLFICLHHIIISNNIRIRC